MTAREEVEADKGRIAVERGPVVYCAEGVDNNCPVTSALVMDDPEFKVLHGKVEGQPVEAITLEAKSFSHGPGKGEMMVRNVTLTLVPYYSWCHRGADEMTVWLAKEFDAVEVGPCEILI